MARIPMEYAWGGVEDITSSFTPNTSYIQSFKARLVDKNTVIIDIAIKSGTPTGSSVATIQNYAPSDASTSEGFRRSTLVGSTGSVRMLIASGVDLKMSGGNATEAVYGSLVYAI